MKQRQYDTLMNHIFGKINDNIVLMTEKEEYDYKKNIVKKIRKDLRCWLKSFPFMHSIPEKK